jgi:hypothetical protein
MARQVTQTIPKSDTYQLRNLSISIPKAGNKKSVTIEDFTKLPARSQYVVIMTGLHTKLNSRNNNIKPAKDGSISIEDQEKAFKNAQNMLDELKKDTFSTVTRKQASSPVEREAIRLALLSVNADRNNSGLSYTEKSEKARELVGTHTKYMTMARAQLAALGLAEALPEPTSPEPAPMAKRVAGKGNGKSKAKAPARRTRTQREVHVS